MKTEMETYMTHKNFETAIDDLEQAFDEFKSNHETRLDEIEAKNARPELELKETTMDTNDLSHKSAFINYLQKGDEANLQAFEQKSLSAGTDKDGGYFIPKAISAKVDGELTNQSVMRSISNIMTISTDAVDLLVDKKDAAVGWAAESAERAETDTPELAKIKISVHEMYARPRATTKLLEDASINVEEWLVKRVGQKMSQMENQAFINGTGVNKPKGFMRYPTVLNGDWEWGKLEHIVTGTDGGFTPDLGADALIDCMNALKPEYHNGAVWLMSRSAHAAVRKLKDQTGQYLWQPSLGAEKSATLLGFPVVISDDMPELTPGEECSSIAFGNFQQGYQIVDRDGMHVLRDPYSAKPHVEFYTTSRVGGDVIDFEAIKIVKFAK